MLCYDIEDENDGPAFTLLQLLTDEATYQTFIDTWGNRPKYDFTGEENIEELQVNIVRVERVLEETKQLHKNFLEGMDAVTGGCQEMTEEMMKKVELIADITIKKQSEVIETLKANQLELVTKTKKVRNAKNTRPRNA